MKIYPKFYSVIVEEGTNSAGLICVTYNFDPEFVGIEYYELMWTFDDTEISIPSGRTATFSEELRVLHQATSTFRGNRKREKQHIEAKLKEVYGSNVTVTFADIQPKR
jgi:hypothetical protein